MSRTLVVVLALSLAAVSALAAVAALERDDASSLRTSRLVVAIMPTVTPADDYFNGFVCGGVLIDASTVVTAGHCLALARGAPLDVVVGADDICAPSGDEERYAVTDSITIDDDDAAAESVDLALLRIDGAVDTQGDEFPTFTDAPSGEPVLVSWAATSLGGVPSCRRWVSDASLPTDVECAREIIDPNGAELDPATETCVDLSPDACQGGSGSPVLAETGARVELVGILTWGVGCRNGYPAVLASAAKNANAIRAASARLP